MIKISQISVLCVLNAKISKSDEKHIKFAKIAVLVPKFQKLSKTVPEHIISKVKSPKVLLKSKVVKFSPLVKNIKSL